jgi:hypothetical protein
MVLALPFQIPLPFQILSQGLVERVSGALASPTCELLELG